MPKRRKFTAEFKAELVISVLTNMKSQAEVCREYQIKPQLFNRWKTQMLENAHVVFQTDELRSAEAERISDLEQALGRKTLELEIAKKASHHASLQFHRNGQLSAS